MTPCLSVELQLICTRVICIVDIDQGTGTKGMPYTPIYNSVVLLPASVQAFCLGREHSHYPLHVLEVSRQQHLLLIFNTLTHLDSTVDFGMK